MKIKASILFIIGFFVSINCLGQNFDAYQKTWATYFGGSGTRLNVCGTNSSGNIIAMGDLSAIPEFWENDQSYYNQFVSPENSEFTYDINLAGNQSIAVKFSQEGDLLWSGYLPFTVQFMEIDAFDNIYISGVTDNPDIGTLGVWNETPLNSEDFSYSFIARLNPDFTINWLSYTPVDSALKFDIDDTSSNLYGVGSTSVDHNITTANTFQSTFMPGEKNGYIFKLSNQGELVWATYYGKTLIWNVNYSKSGLAISAQKTEQENDSYYYTADAYQTTASNQIISRFDPMTGARIYSTYLGHNDIRIVHLTYNNGFYYLFGQVNNVLTDENLISNNAYQSGFGGMQDGYLGKFEENLTPIWGTYIGGTDFESFMVQTNFIIKDDAIYLMGFTTGNSNFIYSPQTYQSENRGNTDLFMMKFSTEGNLIWGSYFGGSNEENFGSFSILNDNSFYLIGATESTDYIATPNVYQENLNVHQDASSYFSYPNGFVTLFSPENLSIHNYKKKDIIIYPNPTKGNVFIKGEFTPNTNLILYNTLGQKIFSKTIKHAKDGYLNLQMFPTGIYYLEFINSNTKTRKKLIIR